MGIWFKAGVAAGLALGAGMAGAQGTIALSVDLRDAPKKILHATETIPVTAGALTLAYPKWIPGEHGPTGPIGNSAGMLITGNGQPVLWERDPVEMYSFHVTVPAGVSTLEVKMDFLATPNGGNFTAGGSTSANLAMLSWNTLLLYPYSGPQMNVSEVMVTPSITLPMGWRYGTALETTGTAPGDRINFKPVSLEQLVDSPVLTGRFFREIELAADIAPKHYLDLAADGPEDLALSQQHIDEFSKLVRETGALYKSRHYANYHFLVTLSDQVAHFGLEHHQSSDDRVGPTEFVSDSKFTLNGLLLPHEFTHSWNGKYRRPAGLATPNYQVPMVGDLLWVYEGLTEYLGDVLAARSGIWTPELYRDRLALIAARYSTRPGRTWRNVEDTARMAQVLYNVGGPYNNWRLGTDFYDEGELVWLDADTTIRQMTNGKKSLDDFVAAFHGLGGNTAPKVVPYTFEDVVAGLNGVVANDWAAFLHERIDSHAATPPLGGIANGGYTLVYKDKPNSWMAMEEADGGAIDFWYSLGLQVGVTGGIGDVLVDGIADKAGFGPGMKIVAVNGREFSPDLLRAAVKDAKGSQTPIEFIVDNTGFFKVIKIDYHEGERYPVFERVASVPDRLDEILKPMAK
jgi:predicted metalloprotease with PDZ domain